MAFDNVDYRTFPLDKLSASPFLRNGGSFRRMLRSTNAFATAIVLLFSTPIAAVPFAETVAAQADMIINGGRLNQKMMRDRLYQLHTLSTDQRMCWDWQYDPCCAFDVCPENPFEIFDGGCWNKGRKKGTPLEVGYRYTNKAFYVGGDVRSGFDHAFGIAFTKLVQSADHDNGLGRMEICDLIPTIYFSYYVFDCDEFYLDFFASYHVVHFHRLERTDEENIPPTYIATSTPDANAPMASLTFGYLWNLCGLKIGPLIGVDYQYVMIDRYTETGAPLPIGDRIYPKQHLQSLVARGGLEVALSLPLFFCQRFKPHLWGIYEYECYDQKRTIQIEDSLGGSVVIDPDDHTISFITTDGPKRDLLLLGAGATFEFCDCLDISFNYERTLINSNRDDYTFFGTIGYRF